MFNATESEIDIIFALTYRYSISIYILTTIFCLVLVIVNDSQINWHYCQIFGISKQALDFVRDGKNLWPRWKLVEKKCHFLTTPPLENGLVQEILHLGNTWRTKFLVNFDSFYGRESISVDFMIKYICVTDRRNANNKLITHSKRQVWGYIPMSITELYYTGLFFRLLKGSHGPTLPWVK